MKADGCTTRVLRFPEYAGVPDPGTQASIAYPFHGLAEKFGRVSVYLPANSGSEIRRDVVPRPGGLIAVGLMGAVDFQANPSRCSCVLEPGTVVCGTISGWAMRTSCEEGPWAVLMIRDCDSEDCLPQPPSAMHPFSYSSLFEYRYYQRLKMTPYSLRPGDTFIPNQEGNDAVFMVVGGEGRLHRNGSTFSLEKGTIGVRQAGRWMLSASGAQRLKVITLERA